jgi:hypothetical protein
MNDWIKFRTKQVKYAVKTQTYTEEIQKGILSINRIMEKPQIWDGKLITPDLSQKAEQTISII